MDRDPTIDLLRGLNIGAMVFYTMLGALSDTMPWLLTHNQPRGLFFGDFVLPLFIFASGMSLVTYERKRREQGTRAYIINLALRVFKLFAAWLPFSLFSSGRLCGMDELALNLVLFLPCALIVKLPRNRVLGIAVGLNLLHLVLLILGLLPDFTVVYLGGYTAAPFYLPIMLCGAALAMDVGRYRQDLTVLALLFFVGSFVAPPLKMELYPSFVPLAAIMGIGCYFALRGMRLGPVEYVGRLPLRFWLLMLALFFVPIRIYAYTHGRRANLELPWTLSLTLAAIALLVLYLVSQAMDRAKSLMSRPDL